MSTVTFAPVSPEGFEIGPDTIAILDAGIELETPEETVVASDEVAQVGRIATEGANRQPVDLSPPPDGALFRQSPRTSIERTRRIMAESSVVAPKEKQREAAPKNKGSAMSTIAIMRAQQAADAAFAASLRQKKS